MQQNKMRIRVDLVLFLVFINSVCGFTSDLFMERMHYIEDRINAESQFRRDDFSVLFNEIGSVKVMLQQLTNNKTEEQNTTNVQTTEKTDSGLVKQYQVLKNDFLEEKVLNTRFRREVPELQEQVQNLTLRTDQISESLDNILNGINFLKNYNQEREDALNLLVIEIPKIIKENIEDLVAEILETGQSDKVKNDRDELKEKIEHLNRTHEMCLEDIDRKNNLIKRLEEECVSKEEFNNTENDSISTKYDLCNCSLPSCPPTADNLTTTYNSCLALYNNGFNSSAVYEIEMEHDRKIPVYCDMTTDGGGWTVFQRRQDGSVDFFKDWNAYKTGFGILTGEFWLGNEYVSLMTDNNEPHELRIDLEDHYGDRAFAKYSSFKVRSERQNYKLEVSSYTGNAGDSLISSETGYGPHNGMGFATKDYFSHSRGSNCADHWKGAWWFNACYDSHLNGPYSKTPKCEEEYRCIVWYTWKGSEHSMKFTEMKFR